MSASQWEALTPLGTLYNPFSISMAIDLMLENDEAASLIFKNSLSLFNGIWNSCFFDSSFSSGNPDYCLEEFLARRKIFRDSLSLGKTLIVTFGTSICYFKKEELPVGNCHKLPASEFSRRRPEIKEFLEYWEKTLMHLQHFCEDVKLIFTVSPVRHLKDGFTANARSKALLLLLVEEICCRHSNCFYFPAFEILNDDLRDYRFYADDLVHPSQEAIEYVWEKFKETFLDAQSVKILEEGFKKTKQSLHRPKTGALGLPLQPNP